MYLLAIDQFITSQLSDKTDMYMIVPKQIYIVYYQKCSNEKQRGGVNNSHVNNLTMLIMCSILIKVKMFSTTPRRSPQIAGRLGVTTLVSVHLDFVLFLPGIVYPRDMGVVNIL